MLLSLRFRVLAGTLAIVLVTIGAVAFLGRRATFEEFDRAFTGLDPGVATRATETLERHHRAAGSWRGVPAVLARVSAEAGRPIVLADASGRLHVPALPELAGASIRTVPGGLRIERTRGDGLREVGVLAFRAPPIVRSAGGAKLGTVYVLPAGGKEPVPRARFASSVSRRLLLLALAVGVVAALAAWAFARHLVEPIEVLTAAARRVAAGDFQRRVRSSRRDELGALATAFDAMAAALERDERRRRELVTDVAHELRTPLTNIRGQIEAMRDGLVRADDVALASLEEEARALQQLVEELQELTLAESGQLRLEIAAISPRAALERAAAAVGPRARAAGIEIVVAAAEDLPAIAADPARLAQVLRNLIDNALTHTPRDGRITLAARPTGQSIELTVRDTGAGIAFEHVDLVFERFHRADPARSRATGGAGLGLAIVRELVRAHGGSVEVESRAGEGACFRIVLPRASEATMAERVETSHRDAPM